jgi:hypothetical protein
LQLVEFAARNSLFSQLSHNFGVYSEDWVRCGVEEDSRSGQNAAMIFPLGLSDSRRIAKTGRWRIGLGCDRSKTPFEG